MILQKEAQLSKKKKICLVFYTSLKWYYKTKTNVLQFQTKRMTLEDMKFRSQNGIMMLEKFKSGWKQIF